MSSNKAQVPTKPLFSNPVWQHKGAAKIAVTAFALGLTCGLGLMATLTTSTWKHFGFYVFALSLFHMWEFLYVAMFHPDELSFNSFLINHSREYTIANVAAVVEYLLERLLFPSMKGTLLPTSIGFILVAVGLAIRILAMYTAGSHFHHFVRTEQEEDHKLVTFGIYHYLRHPSYLGWFWYSIGSQILLSNPLCTVAYALVTWRFFSDRIETEEAALIKFFGDDYKKYRSRTIVGIPLIK